MDRRRGNNENRHRNDGRIRIRIRKQRDIRNSGRRWICGVFGRERERLDNESTNGEI